ncbi:conserved hypothetical protein [Hyphomicrobiales bacterium]|nr:conserved hypothetical protein [Hyphomicrobiales bacterium]CAH1695551.1 conserved hypothetical protein [Hyphomicrobiales bacterium]
MHSFLDAKIMARTLRTALGERAISLSHSDCLELVARQFGCANWNVLAAHIAAATPDDAPLTLPQGWQAVRTHGQDKHYRLGLDPAQEGTALIACRHERHSGFVLPGDCFGVLMQSVIAAPYQGRRMRLTAEVRTEDADAGAIWMRVDKQPGSVLRFDNMLERKERGALRGTQAWRICEVVLDVPEDAGSVHFGFLLNRYGKARARDFRLEAVSDHIAPTAGNGRYLPQPTNLDFTEAGRRISS